MTLRIPRNYYYYYCHYCYYYCYYYCCWLYAYTHTHTRTHPFNGPLSGTTRVSRYQKGKPNLHFTEARDSEWQWHQLGYMQVCTSFKTDNHARTPPLCFYRPDALPATQPTASKNWRHKWLYAYCNLNTAQTLQGSCYSSWTKLYTTERFRDEFFQAICWNDTDKFYNKKEKKNKKT